MKVLVTGGLGYLGSHVVVELVNSGYEVVIADNLNNSSVETLDDIRSLVQGSVGFYEVDIGDETRMKSIIEVEGINAVIHLAAYKSVSFCENNQSECVDNNVAKSLQLIEICKTCGVSKFLFASTSCAYGYPRGSGVLLSEDDSLYPVNAYGRSKTVVEELIAHESSLGDSMGFAVMRYFNLAGSHESGKLGNTEMRGSDNLLSNILKSLEKGVEPMIYGTSYGTPDGTCERDYIHVCDAARATVYALSKCHQSSLQVFNVGSGKLTSVKAIVDTFNRVNKLNIVPTVGDRRVGDIESYGSDTKKATEVLNFSVSKSLEDICRDSYNGYLVSRCGK
jgi:UDP-glucose 4-epimerase